MNKAHEIAEDRLENIKNNIDREPISEDFDEMFNEGEQHLMKHIISLAYMSDPYKDLLEEAMDHMQERFTMPREWWQKYSNLTGKEVHLNDGHDLIEPEDE